MEAIIRHSPITCNGPIYSTYGNSPYPVGVYCTCCAKGSKAKSTAAHAQPARRGSGGSCLPVLAARHEHLCFPMCTQKKKRDRLSLLSVPLILTIAQLIIKIDFLGGRVEDLPLCIAP